MASQADAEIVMRLYDMRREDVMRQARNFMAGEFWPDNPSDVQKLMNAWGTQENAYYRQVTSYWEMAASLPLRGAVDPDLFSDWSGEMFFIFSKMFPFLTELRELTKNPKMFGNIETFINSKPMYQEKLQAFTARTQKMKAARAGMK